MRVKKVKVLWIDDQIGELGPYVAALSDKNLEVDTAASFDEAQKCLLKKSYAIILVDVRMPDPDGIEVVRRLIGRVKGATFALLSSYLYLDRYRDQIEKLKEPIALIDKDMPNVAAPDFDERFLGPILSLVNGGKGTTIDDQKRAIESIGEVNPFELSLNEFMKKSILEKDRIREEAGRLASTCLAREFGLGRKWVLLCGGAELAAATADSLADVPSESQIMTFAVSQQRVPYQFYSPVRVEDFWSTCPRDSRDYPTVTIELEAEDHTLHFDTGAPHTFFSYEELLRIGGDLIAPTSIFGDLALNGTEHKVVRLDVEALLKCQAGGGARKVRLLGFAVREWMDSPLARVCEHGCLNKSSSNAVELCRHRVALVGRNLLTENKISLVLDGRNKRTLIYNGNPI